MKIKYISLASFFLLFLINSLQAQYLTEYKISFPNAAHHEAEVEIWFNQVNTDTLQVLMPRSSPGRYALHEFAKNVYHVKAENESGQTLLIHRPSLHQWNIYGTKKRVKLTYTLFGDRADGTYNGINTEHAHLNMPATFMYAKGYESKASKLQFIIPESSNWKPATQLLPLNNASANTFTFQAPDLQYLMDSPIELADFMFREWMQDDQKIRMAIHHPGTEKEADEYAASTKKIVAEGKAIFQSLPDFENKQYTFIACYMPYADGDGMEHRNSTIVTSSRSLTKHAQDNIGTVSHEFFHAWNVERIRPKALEPFNFQDVNQSGELWFAEGFTSYYGDLILRRSGILSDKEYAKSLTGDLNYVLNAPGSQIYSAVEMSLQAPFVDAARSVDPVNRINTFISYYPFGSVIGLALDLELRKRNLNLDAFMKQVWEKYGKPEKPYSNLNLLNELIAYSDDANFATSFFNKYVFGHEFAPYEDLLNQAGFVLQKQNLGKASLGYVRLEFKDKSAVITSGTQKNSALYHAGLDRGAKLLKLDGKKLKNQKALSKVLEKHKPGDQVMLEYEYLGKTAQKQIKLIEDPALEVKLLEETGKTLTPEQVQFRKNWLGSKSNSAD